MADLDEVRERLAVAARRVYVLADEASAIGARDLRSMLAAVELEAKLYGVIGAPAGSTISVAELKRAAREAGLEVQPRRLAAVP